MKLTQKQIDELLKVQHIRNTLQKRCCDLDVNEIERLLKLVEHIQQIQPHLIQNFLGEADFEGDK